MSTILVADDEPIVLKVLGRFLAEEGRTLLLAGSGDEALALAARGTVDVALLDKNLGDWSGLDLGKRLKERDPDTEVILITAYASLSSVIEAVRLGAYDYVSKPIEDFDALSLKVTNASKKSALSREHRRTLEALRHAQRMEAVGRLAGGIGHDLGNVLSVVLTLADALAAEQPGSEDAATLVTATQRASALVKQMMMLARGGPATPILLSPNGVMHETARMLRHTLGDLHTLATELDPELALARVDPGQLGQVILNLALNARDAMPRGGRVVLRSLNRRLEGAAAAAVGLPAGAYVALEVADEGHGMTPEVRARIFEPFFTTKPAGKGTGLGLAVTFGIVRDAGGAVEVESEPGRGSTFRVLLPAVEEVATADGRPGLGPTPC